MSGVRVFFRVSMMAAVLAASGGHATTVRTLATAELLARADLVVRVEVLTTTARRTNGDAAIPIVTDVTLAIERVYRGTAGPTLTITLPGGRLGDLLLTIDGVPQPVPGERAVAFLDTDPQAFCPLVGLAQGWRRRAVPSPVPAFVAIPSGAWPDGSTVTLQLHLNQSSSERVHRLIDGSTSWDQVAARAAARWDAFLGSIRLVTVPDSPQASAHNNGTNDVLWDLTLFGQPLPSNVLAVTTQLSRAGARVEADVVFNVAHDWDAYRGPLAPKLKQLPRLEDIERVALHEFGHVLGLAHPDAADQEVDALMNSRVSDDDDVRTDDVDGVHGLYGGTGSVEPEPPGQLTARQCKRSCGRGLPVCNVTCRASGPRCRRSCGRLAVKACRRAGRCPGMDDAALAAP